MVVFLSTIRLEDTATKVKKILSVYSKALFNIECSVEKGDVQGVLTRQEFEELCQPLKAKFLKLLKDTFESASRRRTGASKESPGLATGCFWFEFLLDDAWFFH